MPENGIYNLACDLKLNHQILEDVAIKVCDKYVQVTQVGDRRIWPFDASPIIAVGSLLRIQREK